MPVYNPQKTAGHKRKVSSVDHKRNSKMTTNYNPHGNYSNYDSDERYPKSVWKFSRDTQTSALCPTQKPVALLEELIKTYTNEGMLVVDNTCGSGGVGVAAVNTKRNFILIDNDIDSVIKAKNRLGL